MVETSALFGTQEFMTLMDQIHDSPAFLRLEGISLDLLPTRLVSWNVANRAVHSRRMHQLALGVIRGNRTMLSPIEKALIAVSVSLHDVGNPCFSHLSEPFLQDLTGMDGESYLARVLADSGMDSILMKMGLVPADVVGMVTGALLPLAAIVHGSMDLDNIDNVDRYWHSKTGIHLYKTGDLAGLFRWDGNRWVLATTPDNPSIQAWHNARRLAYAAVFEQPHINYCAMIYRAMAFAYEMGQLSEAFFRLNDEEALQYLCSLGGSVGHLALPASTHSEYTQIVDISTTEPLSGMQKLLEDWNCRHTLADLICKQFGVDRRDVCTYITRGNDRRAITLPYVVNGKEYFPSAAINMPSLFRLKVFVSPESGLSEEVVKQWVVSNI